MTGLSSGDGVWMGLRLKNAIAVTSVFLAIIAATYLLYTHVLLGEFDSIERDRANLNSRRVFQSVSAVTDDLRSRTLDWARWDETYQFMRGRNRSYLSTNVNYEAIAPFELVHIIFLSKSLSLVSGQEVAREEQSLHDIPKATFDALISHPRINAYLHSPTPNPLAGLVKINGAPLFISISPITDNQGTAPSNGFLIFTREFSAQLQRQIEERTQLDLAFSSPYLPGSLPESQQTTLSTPSYVETSESEVLGFGIIRDIAAAPVLTFSHRSPRTIYQQGKESRNYVVSLMAICLVFANIALIAFLNRSVIGRLERFARKIKTIATTTDFSLRVTPDGRDEIGTLTETFNSLLCITEHTTSQLADARDAAVQATEAKSRFVAHVSHELRTPIHGLTGLLRILFKGESSPTKRAYLQMAQDSASMLLTTINNILDLSKIESGAVDLQHISFSLREILRAAIRTVTPRIEEKSSVHFLLDIVPGVVDAVNGDPLRIQQILVNLLGNAAKFTQEGSISLRVSLGTDINSSETLVLEVSDTGIGMTEEQLGRVFLPFAQADNGYHRVHEGTGLGLSIVHSLVLQLNGTITVSSEFGRGSIFRVELPLHRSIPHEHTPHPNVGSRGVLLDDLGPFRQWMTECLSRQQCVLEHVSPHDESAIHRITLITPPPDFVLISPKAIETPTVLENLRALREALTCPLIVSLKTSDMTAHERMQEYGGITVVDTPTSAEEVLQIARGTRQPTSCTHSEEPQVIAKPRSCRILVADDAPTSRLIIREMLEEGGYQVETVENGEQLLNRIQQDFAASSESPISLILTDIEMPVLGGLEATCAIRKLEAQNPDRKRLPIIAITAHALLEEQRRFRDGGIDYVVTKPLKPEELSKALTVMMTSKSSIASSEEVEQTEPKSLCTVLCELTERLWGEVNQPRPTSSTIDAVGGIDIADVFERAGESPRRTKLILDAFLGSYEEPLLKVREARKNTDPKEITKAAHSLKGLLLDVGATHTARLAASIERSLKLGDYEAAEQSCEAVAMETIRVATLIERVVRHFPAG